MRFMADMGISLSTAVAEIGYLYVQKSRRAGKIGTMDFKLVLGKILKAFMEQNIRYALMGGFALGAWGAPRGTVDIDFLAARDDMEKVDAIMKGLGYECRYRSENVSQYISPLRVFGEVDFLHAFRTLSLAMLGRAVVVRMFGGSMPVNVLNVADLIGLKVQAIANDEERKAGDLADIESLMAVKGNELDWSLVQEYFALFNMKDIFDDLRRKYGKDQ